MIKTGKRLLLILVLCTLILSILSVTAPANSALPPSLIILVNAPPDDLSISLVSGGDESKMKVRQIAWEKYYSFYSLDMQEDSEYTFRITANGESFECTLDEPLEKYENVVTLNLKDRVLTPGKYPFRSLLLVSIRVLLTLLIEGFIFLLFGFRQKRSWLVFVIVNLITQGALNVWLNSVSSLLSGYLIFSLIFGEILVFAAEMILFPIFIKEHGKGRIILYVLFANFVSLIAGSFIIMSLPV